MAKIQISTVRMMCNAQVINLNAYFVAKAVRLAELAKSGVADKEYTFEQLTEFIVELAESFEEQAEEQKPNKYACQ